MHKVIAAATPGDKDNEINLTPMLDVVFIMLIFFLVVASFVKETGFDVTPPDAGRAPPTASEYILVSIGENNGIWMEQRLIDQRAVAANIASMRAANPNAGVVIRADKRSKNDVLVQVIDAARAVGVNKISLAAAE